MRDKALYEIIADAERTLGQQIVSWTRCTNGLAHFVFDLELADGNAYILRIAPPANRDFLIGSIAIWQRYRGIIPLPEIIYSFLPDTSTRAFTLARKIDGFDMLQCYPALSPLEIASIAQEVMNIQQRMDQTLGTPRFGFGAMECDFEFERWSDFLAMQMEQFLPILPTDVQSKTAEMFNKLEGDFRMQRPCIFIDDLSMKNIILKGKQFNGIIDVDWLLSGDPQYYLAKVWVECLLHGFDTKFVDSLLGFFYAPADPVHLNFYTILCGAEALSWYRKETANGNSLPTEGYQRLLHWLKG